MKLTLAVAATLITGTAAQIISSVPADSKFGLGLLSKARRVADAQEADSTWIANFSLKFQGCHHISQWNANADGDDDVKIETKRLARFRLCPVDSCSSDNAYGCKSGYGDYIVDMDTFLETYMANKEEVDAANCETYADTYCGCVDNGDDQYNEETCQQKCFKKAGMEECVEKDQYYTNIDAADYLVCAAYAAGGDGRARRLDGAADAYYIGPYCSDQGGAIQLGMFTDDSCTEFADEYGGKNAYKTLTGNTLPYSSSSIVDSKCYSCKEGADGYYETSEACSSMYGVSGKCESEISSTVANYNSNACTYMEGIKTTTSSGIISSANLNSNKVASAFVGIFAVSFVLLGSYVYYLKSKLDRGSINLSD